MFLVFPISHFLCKFVIFNESSSDSFFDSKFLHAVGEAFIGKKKFSVIMASDLGLRRVHFITLYQNENFFCFKIFLKCPKMP